MHERVPAGRPWVTLKWAQTLDGRLATATGHSRWISGAAARVFAHRLRAEHGAILVGVGTVRADNPQLTTRLVEGRNPLRVVLDSALRTPPDAALAGPGTLIATCLDAPSEREEALSRRGAEVVRLPSPDGMVDPLAVLHRLRDRGVESVLVEGGAGVITSLIRLRLADEVVIVLAPRLSGAGIDAVGDLDVTAMDGSVAFDHVAFTVAGDDAIFRGRPVWPY
jgi:riboflavin-specific deaminase-like protein